MGDTIVDVLMGPVYVESVVRHYPNHAVFSPADASSASLFAKREGPLPPGRRNLSPPSAHPHSAVPPLVHVPARSPPRVTILVKPRHRVNHSTSALPDFSPDASPPHARISAAAAPGPFATGAHTPAHADGGASRRRAGETGGMAPNGKTGESHAGDGQGVGLAASPGRLMVPALRRSRRGMHRPCKSLSGSPEEIGGLAEEAKAAAPLYASALRPRTAGGERSGGKGAGAGARAGSSPLTRSHGRRHSGGEGVGGAAALDAVEALIGAQRVLSMAEGGQGGGGGGGGGGRGRDAGRGEGGGEGRAGVGGSTGGEDEAAESAEGEEPLEGEESHEGEESAEREEPHVPARACCPPTLLPLLPSAAPRPPPPSQHSPPHAAAPSYRSPPHDDTLGRHQGASMSPRPVSPCPVSDVEGRGEMDTEMWCDGVGNEWTRQGQQQGGRGEEARSELKRKARDKGSEGDRAKQGSRGREDSGSEGRGRERSPLRRLLHAISLDSKGSDGDNPKEESSGHGQEGRGQDRSPLRRLLHAISLDAPSRPGRPRRAVDDSMVGSSSKGKAAHGTQGVAAATTAGAAGTAASAEEDMEWQAAVQAFRRRVEVLNGECLFNWSTVTAGKEERRAVMWKPDLPDVQEASDAGSFAAPITRHKRTLSAQITSWLS
ncbi:unnamed protein product [Closterium sp. Naga37s-1]|nr:unnamed protein product [Closterium sp. Naga37s-1]